MENPITLQEERKVWTIHQSVNGLTYYYNRATRKSQYEMPQCFKTTQQALEHPEWNEYRTAQGKKFYYNASTRKSCWQLPNQVKEYRIKLQEKKKKQRQENGGKVEEQHLSEAEEIKRKFLALLRAKSVNINTKWDSCIKLCEDDPRWQLLKISDKKNYFKEHIAELKKVSQIQKKAKNEVNKAQFIKLLKQNKNLNSDCKMHKVTHDFISDPRWRILDQADRQSTFQHYLDELALKEKQEQRLLKVRNCEMLKSTFQQDCLKHNIRWDEARAIYKANIYYKQLHPYDRISTFVEYILQAERKNDEQSIKQKRLRERSNRVNFRNLLKEKLLSGEINYKTKWQSFLNDFKDDKHLLNMMDPQQQGSTAHEIFQCFMEDIRENHKNVKTQIKHHFKNKGFRMAEDTPNQEFRQKAIDLPLFADLKEIVKDYFHIYFQQKIKAKNQNKQLSAKKAAKKQRKIIFKIFQQLKDSLKSRYNIEDHMQRIEKGMKQFGITISHKNIFKYYLAFLQGNDDKKDNSRSKSKSKSNSNSSNSSKRKRKPKDLEEPARKFTVSNVPKLKDDIEEEGEIKDDEGSDKQKRKKQKGLKKRRRSSSSDSD